MPRGETYFSFWTQRGTGGVRAQLGLARRGPTAITSATRPTSMKRLFQLIVLSVALWLVAAAFWYATSPKFGQMTVQAAGQPDGSFATPAVIFPTTPGPVTVRQTMMLPGYHPTKFVVYGYGTLTSLKVNGHEVALVSRVFGDRLDLGPYLHRGANEFIAEFVSDDVLNIFLLKTYPGDTCRLLLLLLCGFALIPTLSACLLALGFRIDLIEWLIVYGALFLRLVYVAATPVAIRSNDYAGHIEYAQHFMKHVKLPGIHWGWETYQPPLYYALLGFLARPVAHLGMTEDQILVLWQMISGAMSAATLLAGVWIARLLYPAAAQINPRRWFVAILAFLPVLVNSAAHINNDLLEMALAFIWLGLLIGFWREPKMAGWIGIAVVAALAILTKSNGLLLMAIAGLVLLLHPRLDFRTKASWTVILVAAFVMIDGWYEVVRHQQATDVTGGMVSNANGLPEEDRLTETQSLLDSVTFNPWKVASHPNLDMVGGRRDEAPEFFFKSAFIANGPHFAPDQFARRVVLITAMLLLPLIVFGLARMDRSRLSDAWPLVIVLGVLLAAHWMFIRMVPYTSSQDFRYSVPVIVPLAYFLLCGIGALPATWRPAGWTLLLVALATSGAYFIHQTFFRC